MMPIVIIHENPEWIAPLRAALAAAGAEVEEWRLDDLEIDLKAVPPAAVYFSKASASAGLRGNAHALDAAAALFAWLEAHDRRIVNGLSALELERSKAQQILALRAAGLATPATKFAVGCEAALSAARELGAGAPFIVKPDCGGKGAGVRLFQSPDEFEAALRDGDFNEPVVIQSYIAAPSPVVTRLEFIGGAFVYALKVRTGGEFELCPAEACALPDGPRFEIDAGYDDGVVAQIGAMLRAHGVEVAGVEHLVDASGEKVFYDINTSTNYNPAAESRAGVSAFARLADFLTGLARA